MRLVLKLTFFRLSCSTSICLSRPNPWFTSSIYPKRITSGKRTNGELKFWILMHILAVKLCQLQLWFVFFSQNLRSFELYLILGKNTKISNQSRRRFWHCVQKRLHLRQNFSYFWHELNSLGTVFEVIKALKGGALSHENRWHLQGKRLSDFHLQICHAYPLVLLHSGPYYTNLASFFMSNFNSTFVWFRSIPRW